MSDFNFGKITGTMIILCIVGFILQQFIDMSTLYFSPDYLTKPWVLITSLFLHANVIHLAYNLYALFIFGNVLEKNTNQKFTLTIILLGGISGNILFSIISPSNAIGFSGAIYALMGSVTILLPNLKIPLPLGFIAVPAKAWFAGPVMALGELLLSITSFDNIAHSAHLGGFALGFIMSWFWKKYYYQSITSLSARELHD
ncbi:MAG: rhomboid family intramembrane serine protease [Nanoarchaeota archaeon]|nr:rhomboid family intramembrane serine protease [Nanoarchaeota archaeon]